MSPIMQLLAWVRAILDFMPVNKYINRAPPIDTRAQFWLLSNNAGTIFQRGKESTLVLSNTTNTTNYLQPPDGTSRASKSGDQIIWTSESSIDSLKGSKIVKSSVDESPPWFLFPVSCYPPLRACCNWEQEVYTFIPDVIFWSLQIIISMNTNSTKFIDWSALKLWNCEMPGQVCT